MGLAGSASFLVEIFLPTNTNDGRPFGREPFDRVRDELLEEFGGVTLFTRSPAEGLWAGGEGDAPSRDGMIAVEVMSEAVDPSWWTRYREKLEHRFGQDEILIRSYAIRKL